MSEHPAPIGRRLLDVSHLPTYTHGHRDPIWWGVWLLIAIETTMFAMVVTAYWYLKGNFSEWPPPGAEDAPLSVTATTLLLLVASAVPLYATFKAAKEERLRPIQLGMLLATLLGAAAAVARGFEIASIGYEWHSHAYGSLVWAIYFLHTLHVVAGVVEDVVMTVLVFKGPVEKKLMPDLRVSCIYWWFVVASWVVLWTIMQVS